MKQLTAELRRSRFNVKEIHSDLEQGEREQVLLEFRSRRLPILVATDILSRGIDIDSIEMVINYDVPNDGEDYVHRIGRTARAETDGIAFTFISEKEQNKFRSIEELLGQPVDKEPVPAEFGPAPEYSPRSKSGRGGRGGGGGNRRRPGGKPGGGHGGGPGGHGGHSRNNSSGHQGSRNHGQQGSRNHSGGGGQRGPGSAPQGGHGGGHDRSGAQ
ncbi:helicase-related protein [Puia sp. P3]|uniref:helicase-related protein n=1 Tax=Puia sp. P3 TaxID=3423952 RepID=UPI003D67732F